MSKKVDAAALVQTELTEEQAAKRQGKAKKFTYRGVDLEKLLECSNTELMDLFCARQRRKFSRGVSRAPATLLKKLRPHAVSSRLFLLDPIVRDFCGRYLRRTGGTMFELGLLATCWYCDANHCLKLEE